MKPFLLLLLDYQICVFFLLGTQYHLEVSGSINTLHPEGPYPILSECCLQTVASAVPLESQPVTLPSPPLPFPSFPFSSSPFLPPFLLFSYLSIYLFWTWSDLHFLFCFEVNTN